MTKFKCDNRMMGPRKLHSQKCNFLHSSVTTKLFAEFHFKIIFLDKIPEKKIMNQSSPYSHSY